MKMHMDAKSNRRSPLQDVLELRGASAQGCAGYVIFLPILGANSERDAEFVKNRITIKMLSRSLLGLSLILGGCAAIFVGVAGGYRSPLSASPDPGADAAVVDTHAASLLRAASLPPR
jgi:hypothetical protein